MKDRKVIYIGFFNSLKSKVKRDGAVAGTSKMDYIARCLAELGYKVDVISLACTSEKTFKYYKSETVKKEWYNVFFFGTFGAKNRILKIIRYIYLLLNLFFFLIFKVHKGDKVLVYHSLWYFNVILLAKKIKKFHLILEVEEIYQDVRKYPLYLERLEFEMFSIADSFIFSTDSLKDKINVKDRHSIYVYGRYINERITSLKKNDGVVRVVYAGTFDEIKGGALAAVQSARYLPSNYHVHILGFGSEKETSKILSEIKEISSINSCASISYHGLLLGDKYFSFLQKCHIGLSTQNPSAGFNDSSFPSKILVYLANGLNVVSVRIKVIEEAKKIRDHITFYDTHTPQSIAEAVLRVKLGSSLEAQELISSLHKEFLLDLKKLID